MVIVTAQHIVAPKQPIVHVWIDVYGGVLETSMTVDEVDRAIEQLTAAKRRAITAHKQLIRDVKRRRR